MPTAAEILSAPIPAAFASGERLPALQRLGLHTLRDVVFFFPREYCDLTDLRSVAELEPDRLISVAGRVVDAEAKELRNGRSLVAVLIEDHTGLLRALWFNQPFMLAKFPLGQRVLLSGKARLREGRWEMTHPRVRWLTPDEVAEARILPVYPLSEGLTQGAMRRLVSDTVRRHSGVLDEVLPEPLRQSHALLGIREAIEQVHVPSDAARLGEARRRLAFQELLILQLGLALARQGLSLLPAPALKVSDAVEARIRRRFPFELTAGQQQALADVRADLEQQAPMNRLLQGDVGCGKTVVAFYALLAAVAAGHQAALMAPTELLARQQFEKLDRLLAESQVSRLMLSGALTAGQRAAALARIAEGEVQIVVGTQAVVQDDVRFARLGLVVIDEQHRFGVRQRARLKQSGANPHYLVMTATPIPRTVALSAFGDLNVTTIRDAPPGRQPIKTYLALEEQRARWWEFLARKLREGRQAYVVTPAVDADADVEASLENLAAAYEELANGPLHEFRLGILHGRMPHDEKAAAMDAFREGRTQALVATTVVEVGVDVPNATLMTIEGGQRFGLAQLHQLRGRVARGAHPGFCCVFAEAPTDEARQRLAAFARTTDGFELAEIDFRLRGPGNLLGTQQHGMPPLRVADLLRDGQLVEQARDTARALLTADPGLALPEHERLRRMVVVRYGKVLDLGDVG